MRAIVLHQFGPPSVLRAEDVPDPTPGDGDVRIDVEVANVTFVETQIRAGHAPNPAMLPQLPAILGNGVGGTVDGRRVIASLNGTGGYAQRALARRDALIDVPEALSLQDAVALLADGRTAMLLIRAANIQPGERVLVHAAAGGVGTLLTQLAHNAGAHVIAAASEDRKLALARDLGADSLVNYTRTSWPSQIDPVDVVFDGVGGTLGRAAFELLRAGGRSVPFGMASGEFTPVVSDADAAIQEVAVIRLPRSAPAELRTLASAALDEAIAGRLKPVIGQTFPLEQAAAAHAAIEQRQTLGKSLLLV